MTLLSDTRNAWLFPLLFLSPFSLVQYDRPNSALYIVGKEKKNTFALTVAKDTEQLRESSLCGIYFLTQVLRWWSWPCASCCFSVSDGSQCVGSGLKQEGKTDAVFHYCASVLPHLPWQGSFAAILVWLHVPIVISFDVTMNESSLECYWRENVRFRILPV